MKKTIYVIMIIIILSGIYLLSNQTANDSNKLSKSILDRVLIIYTKTTNKELSDKDKDRINYYFRKVAHFTEYFILGLFIYLLLNNMNSNCLLYSILLCLAFACFDELHQRATGYRNPRAMDVLIDMIGASTAFLVLIINKNRKLAK